MKTQHYKNILLTTLLILVSACSAPISLPATTKINICYSGLSTSQIPVLYAYEMGFFKKNNLESNIIYTNGGSPAATSIIAGQADICVIAGSNVVNAAVSGADLVFIGGIINQQVYSLIVRPEIKTANDLKGKSVAISQPGGNSDVSMRAILTKLGLKPDVDVKLLSIGGQRDRGLALESGAVAATLVETVERGQNVLFDMSELKIPAPYTSIATSQKFIKENRATTVNFMKAISEGIAGMKKDKAGAIAVMAKYLKLDPQKDANILEESYNDIILKYMVNIPYPTLEGVRIELATALKTNPNAPALKAETIVDISIVQELEKAGFYVSLYK